MYFEHKIDARNEWALHLVAAHCHQTILMLSKEMQAEHAVLYVIISNDCNGVPLTNCPFWSLMVICNYADRCVFVMPVCN